MSTYGENELANDTPEAAVGSASSTGPHSGGRRYRLRRSVQGQQVLPDGSLLAISRTAADGTDRGAWSFATSGGVVRCLAPDGTQRALQATSVAAAVREVPEAFRLAPHVVHSFDCLDPKVHPADLASLIQKATPKLHEFLWQDPDGWDHDLYYEHLAQDELHVVMDWLVGNLPLTINGIRMLPLALDDRQVHLLPVEVVDGMLLEPGFITDVASVDASNDWGSYSAAMGVLPRGFLCIYEASEDTTISFERFNTDAPFHMHAKAFEWVRGILNAFFFQERPTVLLDSSGDIEIVWPDGHDPEDHGDAASASIHVPQ